jgi:FkbM family methyltransferase
MLRKTIKALLDRAGYGIVRASNNPRRTLIGLRSMKIGAIIDVGANEGQFAKMISEAFPQAQIYCFEPLPLPFIRLESWVKTQGARVTAFNLALGREEGEVEMHYHPEHSPSSSLLATTELTEQSYPFTRAQEKKAVLVKSLDAALPASFWDGREGITLLKLDVQGYEKHVLLGAARCLSRTDACLLEICLDSLYDGQATFKELFLLLDEHGFRYAGNYDQAYATDGHVMWLDALFLRKI